MSDSLRPHGLQHARPSYLSPTPEAYSNLRPSCWWCHPAISSSVILFSSCLQSFPEAGSFLRSWFFTSGGQSTGVSASASILPMNIQDWFPLWKAKVKVLQLTEIMRADLRSDSLRFFLGKDTRKPMCSLLPYTPLSFCHVRTQQEGRIYIPGTYPSLEIKLANTLTLNF